MTSLACQAAWELHWILNHWALKLEYFQEKEKNDEMRFTGHLLGDGVVQVVRLALHHCQDILLADKDDEDPNSLQ